MTSDVSASPDPSVDGDTSPSPLDRSLVIVAGKGGVGRSTWAAACARRAAATGARVLAIDAAGGLGLARALGVRPPAPGTELDLDTDDGIVTLLGLDTRTALDEYVRLHLPLPIPADRLGPIATIFDYVAAAAPGVREILTVGKIAHEVRTGLWDLVVVDAPATGHVIELLDAPRALAGVVGVGPLMDQTAWMDELLHDPAVTATIVVTTPDELPVNETIDLVTRLDDIGHPPVVVANRTPAPLSGAARSELSDLADTDGPLAGAAGLVVARDTARTAELGRLPTDRLGLVAAEYDHPVDGVVAALAEAGW